MNRRGFLKFLSTATCAAALPAIGAAPALGVRVPGVFTSMVFERPITAPAGSFFQNCWFSAEAARELPGTCSFFACYFEGPFGIERPSSSSHATISMGNCTGHGAGHGVVSDPSTADINGDWTLYMGPGD